MKDLCWAGQISRDFDEDIAGHTIQRWNKAGVVVAGHGSGENGTKSCRRHLHDLPSARHDATANHARSVRARWWRRLLRRQTCWAHPADDDRDDELEVESVRDRDRRSMLTVDRTIIRFMISSTPSLVPKWGHRYSKQALHPTILPIRRIRRSC